MPAFTFRTPVVDGWRDGHSSSVHGHVHYHYEEIEIFATSECDAVQTRRKLKDEGVISGTYATDAYLERERKKREELYANVY